MSEIGDRADKQLIHILDVWHNFSKENTRDPKWRRYFIDQILSIPEIAIVDRGAKLPSTSNDTRMSPEQAHYYLMGYEDCKQICSIGGWVKEIDSNLEELCTLIP